MADNEIEILQKVKEGNQKSYELIFRKYYKPLISYSLKYVPDVGIAEDILQDVFCYLWEKRSKIDTSKSFKSYLFTSVHNSCIDYLKKLQHKKKYSDYAAIRLLEAEYNAPDASKKMDFKELEDQINKTILLLPPQCQNVFKLSRISGLKNHEIAEKLNISIKAVEKHISKALTLMVEYLKEYITLFFIFLFS